MRASFSPLRQNILDHLKKKSSPVSAKEIFNGMKLEPRTAFSTIYRALWFLEEKGFISGFSVPCESCGKDRFFTDVSRGHVHYFHCEKCHRFLEIAECGIHLKEFEKKYGVLVTSHSLVLSGLCGKCK
jgi:Fur family transcriptional regulator, ferric uptake regulator